jgi:hypothetical protein
MTCKNRFTYFIICNLGVDELFQDVTRALLESSFEHDKPLGDRPQGDVRIRDDRGDARDQACCNV